MLPSMERLANVILLALGLTAMCLVTARHATAFVVTPGSQRPSQLQRLGNAASPVVPYAPEEATGCSATGREPREPPTEPTTMYRMLLLLGAAPAGGKAPVEEGTPAGCTITAKLCRNFPEYQQRQFRDDLGESHVGAGSNDAACLKRAEDFHHWCGNGASDDAQVAATYGSDHLSQVYHPGACHPGWSQWDAFCYKHFWEKKTWFEAEAACRQFGEGSHLASIHSRAENRFIYTLTNGLSTWIGYTDLDQDTHFQWSDSTQDDFSNFAKNCTGREHEPDCKPEERQQQWYDWEGNDRGTFVCKRNALLPMALLRNVSARTLISRSWGELLPALAAGAGPRIGQNDTLPTVKVDEITKPPLQEPAASKSAPEPRLALPKVRLGFLKVLQEAWIIFLVLHFSAGHGLGALAAASALAALAARRRGRNDATPRVVMQVRKPTRYAKPAAKGMKPMIHRKETRDVFKDGFEGWVANKDKNIDFMEKVVRQQLHGRFQFQFASQHFFDTTPMSSGMSRNKRDFGIYMNHDYDDMFYVRKFLEPAKFKKLALGNWEMPENATKVATMQELVAAGVQYGHKSNKWNPAMLKYLYADNDGTHIFDLVQTAANLNRACYYCMEAAAKGASFILIGTKEQARPIVAKYSEEAGIHYTDMKRLSLAFAHLGTYSLRPALDTMAAALQDAEGNPGPLRDLTLVEQARIESTRWVALLRMGIPPDSMGTPGPSTPAPVAGPGAPASGGQAGAGSRRLTLSAVLDPTLDADVVSLGNLEIQKLYADYMAKFGDHPSAEADPSADQLASLKQVVAAGSVPYADFSLFGPHGLRLLRKQTFTSYTLNVATGEWSKKEQPGPSSYHSWVEAWKVYRTALLLLETVDAERLDAYAEHVRCFVTQFGDSAWWLVYRAENRLRCEHMERLRRTLHDKPAAHGYTAARPWNAVFARPFATGTIGPVSWSPRPPSGCRSARGELQAPTAEEEEEASRVQAKKKKRYEGEDHSVKQDGVFVKNRRGAKICPDFNKGKCGSRFVQPKPKVRAGADPNQGLVDRTAQPKAAGASPPSGRGPAKPPTPPRPLKRKAGQILGQHWAGSEGSLSQLVPFLEPRPQLRHGRKGAKRRPRGTGAVSTKSLVQVPPVESTYPDYEPLARGPREYGTWMEQPSDSFVTRPWVLVLFSGRRRKGDLPNWLAHYGLMVCCLDLVCDTPCDVLDEAKWSQVEKDINDGNFAACWAATSTSISAGSASALVPKEPRTEREEQNGQALGGMRNPRRSLDRVQGARQVGRALHKGCLAKWPGLKLPAKAILRGETPDELDDKLVDKVSVSHPPRPSDAQASPGVLHEGPAIVRPRVGPGEAEREGEGRGQESEQSRHGEARAYARGSAVKSLDALSDPAHCRQTLLSESRASTSVGPVESRLKLWETMSLKANLEPFRLTPEGMYTIMGGLKIGGYRSATQWNSDASVEVSVRDEVLTSKRFVGGLLSNFPTVRKSVELMQQLREEKQQGAWNVFNEFQRFKNTCKLERLTKKYHGVEEMTGYPDICIFVDEIKERNPIAEMVRIGVPCIGMVDSNNDPKFVDIAIPSNTSNTKSIDLIIGKICDAIKKGKTMNAMTQPGERNEEPKEWDPWILSRDRMRCLRRRSKRQGWMKGMYGSYENWKKCHPWGAIPTVAPFHDFKWNDIEDRRPGWDRF
ncbi:rpsB [Symbiodinium microadriaticum]|nr:rpsB [Symbiodinium microadriaticum]